MVTSKAVGARRRESASSSNSKIPVAIPNHDTLQTHQSAARRPRRSRVPSIAVAVTGVSSPASSQLAVSHNARGRRQKVVAAQACSRDLRYISSRDGEEEEKEGWLQTRGLAAKAEWWSQAKFGRRAALKWRRRRGIREKKSISTLPAPRGGARCEAVWRVPTDSLLKRRTRAQIIIRRHGNARPIARFDALWIFSFLSLTLCPLFPPVPHWTPFKRLSSDPAALFLSLSPAERMALMKPCFFSFWRSPTRVHLPSLTLTGKTRQREGS